jgi:ribonucleoside-triphosphate reductase (formate)
MVSQVKKRDESIVLFNKDKITNAIFRAATAVGGKDKDMARELADQVEFKVQDTFKDDIPSVEQVQDLIEDVLIDNRHSQTAKAYIKYRQQRAQVRETKKTILDVDKTMQEYLGRLDWRVNENSNVGFSLGGLILYISGKITANYWLNNIYSPEIKEAHHKGDLHIHDLSMFSPYSFYRNEAVVVRKRNEEELLVLSFEQLFDLVQEKISNEDGFEMKYNSDYEILDEKGWTPIQRVLRHKTDKKLISFNSKKGNNLITTEDHPFITLEDTKEVKVCKFCASEKITKTRSRSKWKDYYRCKDCNETFHHIVEVQPQMFKKKVMLAKDVKLDNYMLSPSKILNPLVNKSTLTDQDAWFIGLFIAEGWFSGNSITLKISESAELDRLVPYLEENSKTYSMQGANLNSDGTLEVLGEVVINVGLRGLNSELQTELRMIRQGAENKNLPINFLSYENQLIGGMVSGVIDGDGVVRNDDPWVSRVVLRMTSKTLLSQIQLWLDLQGIRSSLSSIDGYGEREYKGNKIIPKKQLYALRFYIPESKKEFFSESLKIGEDFKFSKRDFVRPKFSDIRKIEEIENDSGYVYDITTGTHSFLCNGVLSHNCAGWSMKQLLSEGFGGVAGQLKTVPPKHFDTVIGQMVNFLGTMQNEWAGAQALSSVDTYLAPYVRQDKMSYKTVKQQMQRLLFNIATPSRWGTQTPFINFTFDWVVPEDMREEHAILGGKLLNTKYKDYQVEMDMINKAFLECMVEGDASGRIFTFPIPTYNITKEFDWDSENANLLFEVTAKYGIPYFQNFINSSLKPSDVRSMCCRLQLEVSKLRKKTGGLFGSGELTGSIGVVTINLPRIGYQSKTKEEFLDRVGRLMEIGKNSLEIKRKVVVKYLDSGLLPYAKRYLGSFDNHFSTIGLVGMNEALLNFIGKDIATDEGRKLALEILDYMRDQLQKFQKETNNIYNLEATPAEGTSYRLARIDKQMFPEIIAAGREEPYYTNSTQLPVNYTDDIFEALDLQEELQSKYTGGTVFHTFIGEKISNSDSCKELVKKIAYNYKLPYFTLSPTFSVCPKHGYLDGEHHYCPKCDTEIEAITRKEVVENATNQM